MTTRYTTGEVVKYGDEFAEIVEVEGRNTDSPKYTLDFLTEIDEPPQEYNPAGLRFRASDLEKMKRYNDWEVKAKAAIEEELGLELEFPGPESPVDTRHSNATMMQSAGGEKYLVFKNEEASARAARNIAERDLRERPQMFNNSFLKKHIRISDSNKRQIANDDARHMVNSMDAEGIIAEAGISEHKIPDDPSSVEYDETLEIAEEEAEVKISERIQKRIEEDPYEYFVEEQGIYTPEDFFDQHWVRVNEEEAAEEAVSRDGDSVFINAEYVTQVNYGEDWAVVYRE